MRRKLVKFPIRCQHFVSYRRRFHRRFYVVDADDVSPAREYWLP